MHSYGRDFRHTSYIHLALALITYLIYEALGRLPLPADVPFHPFITLTIFGALELVFNRWAWRLLCLVKPLHIHDFGGTYSGQIRAEKDTSFPVTITIKQNWSDIEIDFESGEATSKSFSASITKDRLARGQVEIVYNYYAQGTHEGDERVGAHYGTAMLVRQARGKKLEGQYYTEGIRERFGRIAVERK